MTDVEHTTLVRGVADYYSGRLAEHGATPQGVDWNSAESQCLRFDRLLAVVGDETASLVDYGCGYGALVDHLIAQGRSLRYSGFDAADAMVVAAEERHRFVPWASFTSDREAVEPADVAVASGIFNVKLDTPAAAWREYVLSSIDDLAALGRRGFAFNVLTSLSDPERQRDDLYYADPAELFEYCARRYARLGVAVLHDYGLFEFTVIVRREERNCV